MQLDTSYYLWPGETHFGFGTAVSVADVVRNQGANSVLVVTDAGIVAAGVLQPITEMLTAAGVPFTLFDGVVANPDIESVQAAAALYRESGADLILGVGGGSSLDTAKAVKLLVGGPAEATIWEYAGMLGDEQRPYPPRTAMPPYVAIPTTAGTGAEVTPWGVITKTDEQRKFGVGNKDTIPDVAILDPDLTLTLPPFLTAATGMDALSHLVEAYVSTNHNPVLDPMILHGIELIGRYLRVAVARGDNREARYAILQASMIGGIGITSKYLGACHSLAHPLSGLAGVQHGLACGMMLPYQIAYSIPGARERYAAVAAALEPEREPANSLQERALRAVTAVHQLLLDVGLPHRLRDVGVTQDLIEPLGKAAYEDLNWWTNPRQVSAAALTELYQKAY